MEKIPASVGWDWITKGYALFRKQPADLSMLFFMYLLLTLGLVGIPVVGPIMFFVFSPVFSMTFMHACADIEQDKRVLPNLLFIGFRSPALRTLVILGVLSLVTTVAALGSSALIDGGMFWNVMSGQIKPDEKAVQESDMALAMLVALAVYIPAAMAFWYAAPLVAWQNMKVGKALFYSFFSVRKAGRAFVLYFLIWGAVGFVLLIGTSAGAIVIFAPLAIVLTLIRYCSFYPSYTTLFGSAPVAAQLPEDPPAA